MNLETTSITHCVRAGEKREGRYIVLFDTLLGPRDSGQEHVAFCHAILTVYNERERRTGGVWSYSDCRSTCCILVRTGDLSSPTKQQHGIMCAVIDMFCHR